MFSFGQIITCWKQNQKVFWINRVMAVWSHAIHRPSIQWPNFDPAQHVTAGVRSVFSRSGSFARQRHVACHNTLLDHFWIKLYVDIQFGSRGPLNMLWGVMRRLSITSYQPIPLLIDRDLMWLRCDRSNVTSWRPSGALGLIAEERVIPSEEESALT